MYVTNHIKGHQIGAQCSKPISDEAPHKNCKNVLITVCFDELIWPSHGFVCGYSIFTKTAINLWYGLKIIPFDTLTSRINPKRAVLACPKTIKVTLSKGS